MSTGKLKYLSVAVTERLMADIDKNLDIYVKGDFTEMANADGWGIEASLDVDLEPLSQLKTERSPEAEVLNSLLVWKALGRLSPSLAGEERIWTRLTHVEGLAYSRSRWLAGRSGQDLIANIKTHLFADTQTKCRDDNAIGRLWWAAYIARIALPDDQLRALKAILKSADIRSNIVERPRVSSRPKIAAAIVRAIVRMPRVTDSEDAFRTFMKNVNRSGGGVLFEAMSDDYIDRFMDECSPTSAPTAATGS